MSTETTEPADLSEVGALESLQLWFSTGVERRAQQTNRKGIGRESQTHIESSLQD